MIGEIENHELRSAEEENCVTAWHSWINPTFFMSEVGKWSNDASKLVCSLFVMESYDANAGSKQQKMRSCGWTEVEYLKENLGNL